MKLIQGNILDANTDAIVNPANNHLAHGGGLAAIIDHAAQGSFYGADLEFLKDQARNGFGGRDAAIHDVIQYRKDHVDAPLVPTGGAYTTGPGLLVNLGIIHAVGPVWGGGGYFESDLLAMALHSAADLAAQNSWETLAVPAISCGIFGYPVELASRVLVSQAQCCEFLYDIEVDFYLFEDAHMQAFRAAVNS